MGWVPQWPLVFCQINLHQFYCAFPAMVELFHFTGKHSQQHLLDKACKTTTTTQPKTLHKELTKSSI